MVPSTADPQFSSFKSDKMRPGQNNSNNNNNNKNRSRGRNNNGGRKHLNPLSRNYESNGPDVKVRGNAAHVAEKYVQLARDAHASGDSVMAENYLQHAEHYFRIVSAAQPQMVRTDPFNAEYEGEEGEDDFGSDEQSRFDIPQFRNNANNANNGNNGQQQGERSYNDDRQGRGEQNQGERQPRFDNRQDRGEQPQADSTAEAVAEGAEAQDAAAPEAPAQGEGEPRRMRERRPRRRRPPMGENGVDPNGPQPEVGELPAFITAGGATNPAE
jgi:hypothetical protein